MSIRERHACPERIYADSRKTHGVIGAVSDPHEIAIDLLLANSEIGYLSEMKNVPGVLSAVPEVMEKIMQGGTK